MIDIQTVTCGRNMYPLCRAAIAEIQTRGNTTLLENGPSVMAKGTSCCCSRYLWYPIGTGYNSSWYLWPWTNLVEDNWHRVVVATGSNVSA